MAASRRNLTPLKPVSVQAHFVGGASRADCVHGAAVLEITDNATGEAVPYWLTAILAEGGDVCTGFKLQKFGTGETYLVNRSLISCTCGDATHRPTRPGGCRHQAALRQALPTVTGRKPAPAPARVRRDEECVPVPA